MHARYIYLSFLFTLASLNGSAQQQLTENAQISLLSVDSGKEAYNIFGHSAIKISDPSQSIDYIFHYGLFSFNDPGFYTNFLAGRLLYRMGAQRNASFIRTYSGEERTVYEQKLNITQEDKQAMYNYLYENYKPENRDYYYDFFFDNCSTRIEDCFNATISGIQWPTAVKYKRTFRDMLDEHLTPVPWVDYGIDLIIGPIADDSTNVGDQMFLPMYLHDHLNNTFVSGKSIVIKDELALDYIEEKQARKPPFLTPFKLFLFLLGIELLLFVFFIFKGQVNPKWLIVYDASMYFIISIGSLILLFMWFGTNHVPTKHNWNLAWMNPLYILVLLFLKKRKSKAYKLLLTFIILITLLSMLGLLLIPQAIHPASNILSIVLVLKLLRTLLDKTTTHSKVA